MKKFLINLLWLCLPFLLGVITLLILPFDKEYGYHFNNNVDCNTAWVYARIFENPAPVDVAFIGTSHTGCGINDSLIEKSLGGQYKIANLAYCRGGRNLQFAVLKDLFKKKSPKVVFIEVREEEKHSGHPEFSYISDTPDLLNPVWIFNRKAFSDIGMGIKARFDYHRRRLTFDPKTIKRNNYSSDHNHTAHLFLESPDVLSVHKTNQKNRTRLKPAQGWERTIYNTENRFPEQYLSKMLDLCQQHKATPVFLYIPEYGTSMDRPMHHEFYEQRTELWLPPKKYLEYPSFWVDTQHLNYYGAKRVSEWLAGQLMTPEYVRLLNN